MQRRGHRREVARVVADAVPEDPERRERRVGAALEHEGEVAGRDDQLLQVRRAGLDLRNNLKWLSFGHLNVMRVEVMQLLEEAFKILNSEDVKRLFGADNAWDVVEEVLIRYYNERLVTSPRQRMGVTGREVLRWLAQPHILQTTRSQFETLLLEIAEQSEEWLTSAQAMNLATRPSSEPMTTSLYASPGNVSERSVPAENRRVRRPRRTDRRGCRVATPSPARRACRSR